MHIARDTEEFFTLEKRTQPSTSDLWSVHVCRNLCVLLRGPEMMTKIANPYMLSISSHTHEISKWSVPIQKKECKGLCIKTD